MGGRGVCVCVWGVCVCVKSVCVCVGGRGVRNLTHCCVQSISNYNRISDDFY